MSIARTFAQKLRKRERDARYRARNRQRINQQQNARRAEQRQQFDRIMHLLPQLERRKSKEGA